jgi:Kdo2-lipid IVA lauroyltransferase/acyltransferase
MSTIGFYIFYGLNWIITLLPLGVLYLFADLAFPVFYYFPGYRRKIVRTNLKNSFPGKSESEITDIEKKFYRHLCDLFIETFKLSHMSRKQLLKRFSFTNPELLEKLYDEGRDIAAIMGHYGNWEWSLILPLYSRLKFISIYKPLANRHFDKFMINTRSQFGMTLTPMQNVVREIISNKKNNIKSLYSFLSDQTPPRGDIKYWTSFLNQDTPVYIGAEKIAMKYNMVVVFFNIKKIKRGYYTITAELLIENTAGLPEHAVTRAHVKRLEEIICENPQYWIWSHRRWKHKREDLNG